MSVTFSRAPGGNRAELHVTALRGVLREVPKEPGNAVRLLGEAAAHLLAGLRPQAVTARRAPGGPRRRIRRARALANANVVHIRSTATA